MKPSRFFLLATIAIAALSMPLRADHTGSPLPAVDLDGLAQTKAKSFDDFAGRAVLIEFFAFW